MEMEILMEIGHARGDMSLSQRAAKQKCMSFWPCDESKWYVWKGYDAGKRKEEKEAVR